jgi:hypothetical protein
MDKKEEKDEIARDKINFQKTAIILIAINALAEEEIRWTVKDNDLIIHF